MNSFAQNADFNIAVFFADLESYISHIAADIVFAHNCGNEARENLGFSELELIGIDVDAAFEIIDEL